MKKLIFTVFVLFIITSFQVIALPDIAITNMEILEEEPVAGDIITVKATVTNIGNEPIPHPQGYILSGTNWLYKCQGEFISSDWPKFISELSPGEETYTESKWRITESGKCQIEYRVDVGDQFQERTEENNFERFEFYVYYSLGCEDSDDKEHFEKGTVTLKDETFDDYCTNSDGSEELEKSKYVKEFFCEDNLIESEIRECPYDCKEGLCRKNEYGDLNLTFVSTDIECEGILCNYVEPEEVRLYIDDHLLHTRNWADGDELNFFSDLPKGTYKLVAEFEYQKNIEKVVELTYEGLDLILETESSSVECSEIKINEVYETGEDIKIVVENIGDVSLKHKSECIGGVHIERFEDSKFQYFIFQKQKKCGSECDYRTKETLEPGQEKIIGHWNQKQYVPDTCDEFYVSPGKYRITFMHDWVRDCKNPQKEFTIVEKQAEEEVPVSMTEEDIIDTIQTLENEENVEKPEKQNFVQKIISWILKFFT